MKFGNRFRNLLRIKRTKLYSDSFRFNIFIARCLYRTQCIEDFIEHIEHPLAIYGIVVPLGELDTLVNAYFVVRRQYHVDIAIWPIYCLN